ncbi:MAG: O-antigen ligase family protein [Candidatus Daviesbacteria bacterium]|nr:O-antigen ligase family protein [Candidatus Daviesbacteria bacterium]
MVTWILTSSILIGQLVKIPLGSVGGVTVLDVVVLSLCTIGLTRFKFKKIPIFFKSALLFIIIAIISLTFTPLKLEPEQYLISFSYIIRFFSFILLGWLIYLGIFPNIKTEIVKILTYSGIGLAILGIMQFIFLPDMIFLQKDGWDPHYFRTVSSFLDPNFLGAFMSLTLLLIMAMKNARMRFIFFVLVFISLLTTFSRGAYLGFTVAFLTFSILNKSIKLLILTISLSVILILSFMIYQNTVAAPKNIDRTQSAQYRYSSYQQGLAILEKHPLLGVGFNTYRFAISNYHLADEEFLQSRGASTNDSSLLFVAATTGVIGLIAYLLFLGSLLWIGWKKNLILLAGLLGLTAQSFFANTLFYPHLLIWIILIAVISPSLEDQKK